MKLCSPIVRAIALSLIVAQCVVGVPALAFAPDPRPQEPHRQEPPPPEKPVTANRTVPDVVPPSTVLSLPAFPTDQELSRARIFPEPLVPMPRGGSRVENAALARAIMTYAETKQSEMVAPLLMFLLQFPQRVAAVIAGQPRHGLPRRRVAVARAERVGAGLG